MRNMIKKVIVPALVIVVLFAVLSRNCIGTCYRADRFYMVFGYDSLSV